MRTWRWYSKVLFALLVAAFAYFVWPTPYAYFVVEMPARVSFSSTGSGLGTVPVPGGNQLIRVNRFTGLAYEYGREGWRPHKP